MWSFPTSWHRITVLSWRRMEQVLEAKRSLLASRMETWTCQNRHGSIRCGFLFLSPVLSKIWSSLCKHLNVWGLIVGGIEGRGWESILYWTQWKSWVEYLGYRSFTFHLYVVQGMWNMLTFCSLIYFLLLSRINQPIIIPFLCPYWTRHTSTPQTEQILLF